MSSDDRRRWFSWLLGVLASIATTASVLVNFRDAINWRGAASYATDVLTVSHIVVALSLSLYFTVFNRRPMHRAFVWFFLMYSVGALWALLTDLIPAIFGREIRSLVYRGLMVSNCSMLLFSLLTWAKPHDDDAP